MRVFADVFCVKNSSHFPLIEGVGLLTETNKTNFVRKNFFTLIFSVSIILLLYRSISCPPFPNPHFYSGLLFFVGLIFCPSFLPFPPLSFPRPTPTHPLFHLPLSFSHLSFPSHSPPIPPADPCPLPTTSKGGPGYNPLNIF